jgi:hypothetical protein
MPVPCVAKPIGVIASSPPKASVIIPFLFCSFAAVETDDRQTIR